MTERTTFTERESFLSELDAVISRHAMLSHPFYQCWNEGKLSRDTLAQYAKQYYAHVSAFPTYVSATHANCDDLATRQMLLENLIEEERGLENHPELWLRFAEGLGVSRNDVKNAELLDTTQESVRTIKQITRSENYIEGVAALYAYESQIPEVARSKREGLKSFYGIEDDCSVAFFRVHEEADVDHRQMERSILSRQCESDEARARVLKAAESSAKALWHFLDGVYAAYIEADSQQSAKA
jgi:pyrroloquinoline-quinone synthase